MKRRNRFFRITSLAAAGFASALVPTPGAADDSKDQRLEPEGSPLETPIVSQFQQENIYTLVAHRSHSSHRSHGSHGSHSSHRSSAGSSGRSPVRRAPAPARNYRSTPRSSVLPSTAAISPGTRRFQRKYAALLAEVQRRLKVQSHYFGAVDGRMGPNTAVAITRFERANGLPSTGNVTCDVLDKLGVVLSKYVDTDLIALPGNSAKFKEIMRRIQTALYALGFYNGAIDGLVGPKTQKAIRSYQRSCRLPQTGRADSEILNALRIKVR